MGLLLAAAGQLGPQLALAPVSEAVELILVPADQRRNQQAGKIEVVERLNGEADRRQQILDRQRLVQVQPVDAGDRNALGVKPGNDQRGQFAPAADQDQDVAGRAAAAWWLP